MRSPFVGASVIKEEILKNIAHIIGENSAAAGAIKDIQVRRTKGEDPICFQLRSGTLIVTDRKNVQDNCHQHKETSENQQVLDG
jgi:hypothetical protein